MCVDVLKKKILQLSFVTLIGEKAWLLFANRHDIRKLEVDGMILQPVVSDLQSAIAVDYDYYNKVVYWSDSHEEKIMK